MRLGVEALSHGVDAFVESYASHDAELLIGRGAVKMLDEAIELEPALSIAQVAVDGSNAGPAPDRMEPMVTSFDG